MQVRQLLQKIQRKLGPYEPKMTKNGYEYSFRCPFCQKRTGRRPQKKKFSVRIDERDGRVKWKCWVADCSIKGVGTKRILGYELKTTKNINVQKLSKQFILKMLNPKEQQAPSTCQLPKDFKLLMSQGQDSFKAACFDYLHSRGISDQKIRIYNVGYSSYLKRIVFPSYDQNFKLNFWSARVINGDNKKWLHRSGYNNNQMVFNQFFVNWSLPVMIVQGVFDWLNARNAIPLMGGSLTKRSRLYKLLKIKRPKIILRLDNDAKRGTSHIYDLLTRIGVPLYVLRYPGKDLGQFCGKLKFMINRQMKFVIDEPNVYVEKIENPLKLMLQGMLK